MRKIYFERVKFENYSQEIKRWNEKNRIDITIFESWWCKALTSTLWGLSSIFQKNSNLISTKNPSWKFIEDLNDLTPRKNNENINLKERFSNLNPLSSFH